MRRTIVLLAGVLLGVVGAGGVLHAASASTPTDQKVDITSKPGKYVWNWTGTIPPGAEAAKETADSSPCVNNSTTDDIEHFQFSLANSRVYKEANISFTFEITWQDSIDAAAANGTDSALNVLGPNGGSLGYSDGGTQTETVKLNNLDEGPYTALVCGFSRVTPGDYQGKLTLDVTSKAQKPKAEVNSIAQKQASNGGGSGSNGNNSSIPYSPNSPAITSPPPRAAVGAGRILPTDSGSALTATPAPIDAAPSAFRGIGDATKAQAAPPGITVNKKHITKLPWWVLIVTSVAGVALLVFGLLARRRRGLDRAPGTSIVPVLAET